VNDRRDPSGENLTFEIRACAGMVTFTCAPSAIFFSAIE